MRTVSRLVVPLVLLVLVAAAAVWLLGGESRKHVTASFPRTISIYEGSDVRVLGVPVGTVESVTPKGTRVEVRMSYDADVKVPVDVDAVIVAPSVVGDRFVQLTPVWTEGEVLPDDASLDGTRTGTPVELDDIYSSIDQLAVALGPDGANADGAFSDLLRSTAANLAGQGETFNQTVKDLGRLSGTLDNNRDELFGAAAELESFIGTLAENDQTVRDFNQSLAQVSEMLAGERDELSAALRHLSVAMRQVTGFVKDNRDALGSNIKGLNRVSRVLVRQRDHLEEILTVAPLALNNLALTYNPESGTLDTRANLLNVVNELTGNPEIVLCGILNQVDTSGAACDLVGGLFPRAGALTDERWEPEQPFDLTLGGFVEVTP